MHCNIKMQFTEDEGRNLSISLVSAASGGVWPASGGVWPASGPASRVWAASLARLSRLAGLGSVPGSPFVVVGSVPGWSLASFFNLKVSRPGRVLLFPSFIFRYNMMTGLP